MEPEDRLTEGITALGVEPTVARAIAVMMVQVECKSRFALYNMNLTEQRMHTVCRGMLTSLLHQLATDDADWRAWSQTQQEASRAISERCLTKYRARQP
ncbi:MAG: hypothetical protein ACOYJ1_16745 [Peptococcales bacterium]|jgi:hypothetical protein